MTPRQLQAFVCVAQTLSFARAGELLHLSQPALSLAIRALEDSLGGRLLTRSTRQVRLTPEGAMLLPLALQLLADWDNTRERLRHRFTLQRGHVTLAAMPSFAGNCLPAILKSYREQYPNVEITVHDVVHEQVANMVASGRVEIGMCFQPEADNHLTFSPLFVDRFIAIVPPDSPIADDSSVDWTRLLAYDFIALQRPSTVRTLLERSLEASGINLTVMLECHQLSTIGQMVASGLGVSAVPAMCTDQMIRHGARCLALNHPEISRPVGLLTRSNQELSVAAAAMFSTASAVAAR